MCAHDVRWLSVDEICHYLGVCNDTVYTWIEKNYIPSHRMGRHWKFKKKDVDAQTKAGGASKKAENK